MALARAAKGLVNVRNPDRIIAKARGGRGLASIREIPVRPMPLGNRRRGPPHCMALACRGIWDFSDDAECVADLVAVMPHCIRVLKP